MSNTELLCYILEFQSRSLIVRRMLQAESGVKEYEADWLTNAKVVTRDATGRFASKGSSIKQSVQDATAILKQGFDLTTDTIQSLLKDPEFRKRAGLAAGLPMAKLISNLATQARLNPKLTEKLDEWIANATKEFADQYGDDKSPMAQAIRNSKLTQPPKDASFNEKMEFRVAQFAAYKEALESPEDYSKRDEIIGKAAVAAIPIGVSLAIALGFEVAIPLFMAQGVNWATVLSSVAIGEAADFAVQKGMDKLEINNPALRIGASMVAGILAGGLVTGVNNKITFAKQIKETLNSLGKPKLDISAQDLDNINPDHYASKGVVLPYDKAENSQKRINISRIIDDFTRKDEFKTVNYELKIASNNKGFVVKINSKEKDGYGRLAPILAHGNLPKGLNEAQLNQWADETIQEIEQFATDIGRTFNSQTLKDLRTWFTGKEQVESLAEKEAREFAEGEAARQFMEGEKEKTEWEVKELAKQRARREAEDEAKNKLENEARDQAIKELWQKQMELTEQRLKSLDEILKADPSNSSVLRERGDTLNGLGRFKEAIESLDESLKINPNNAETLRLKALSLNGLNRPKEALKFFESALKLDPDNELIKMNIDGTLTMIKSMGAKIPAFTPIDPMSLNKVGDLQSAIASLNKEWREQLGLFKGVSTEAKGSESQKITILRGRLKDLQNKIDLHIQNQK